MLEPQERGEATSRRRGNSKGPRNAVVGWNRRGVMVAVVVGGTMIMMRGAAIKMMHSRRSGDIETAAAGEEEEVEDVDAVVVVILTITGIRAVEEEGEVDTTTIGEAEARIVTVGAGGMMIMTEGTAVEEAVTRTMINMLEIATTTKNCRRQLGGVGGYADRRKVVVDE